MDKYDKFFFSNDGFSIIRKFFRNNLTNEHLNK